MLASDCFSIEDTDGDEGTLVAFVLQASGALSRLSEGLDLLLNLLEMLDNRFLLSFTISSLVLVFDAVFDVRILLMISSDEGASFLTIGGGGALPLLFTAPSALATIVLVETDLSLEGNGLLVMFVGEGEIDFEFKGEAYWCAIISSFALHTGRRLVLISTAVCSIGFEICRLRKLALSCFWGPSSLLSEEVGDRLLVSSEIASVLSILCLSLVGVLLT